MKPLQFYKYAAFGLLALNIAILTFFFMTRHKRPHHSKKEGKAVIAKTLKLNDSQHSKFIALAEAHVHEMNQFDAKQKDLLTPYFYMLIDSSYSSTSDSVMSSILLLERHKIESTYAHFKDVQTILSKEQEEDFKDFMNIAIGRILLDQQKMKRPPKDF